MLERRGHTEAAVDLARLAGLPPVAVICEVLQDDGSPAPTNLTVPPYRFVGDELIIVGEDTTGASA